MCIAILNNGKKLTRKALSNCWVSNDDGAGMLYIDNGKLAAFKQPNHDGFNVAGRDFDNFVNEYDRVYKLSKASNKPVLIHFRIATHGLDPEYLHPFLVSDNVGLIHNGIIYGYGTRDVSDTAEFAQELATLPKSMTADVKFLDIDFISNSILDKLEASNKVVFMDNTGDYRIFNAQLGHWSNGNWFSNYRYCESNFLNTKELFWTHNIDDYDYCQFCGLELLEDKEIANETCYGCMRRFVTEMY